MLGHEPIPAKSRPRRSYRRIQRLWRVRPAWYDWPLRAALLPVATAYEAIVGVRRIFWHLMGRRAEVMTISVGNLTVGGNGKTPFTLFLAQLLSDDGLKIGIVSRGYRGIARRRAALVSDGAKVLMTAEQAGDEPVMMAKQFDGPIAIGRRRIHAIELLGRSFKLDAVILDDAFQHIRLKRDIDLLLVNADRGFGSGRMLPAGPMRERVEAARRADAIVLVSSGGRSALSRRQRAALERKNPLRARIQPRGLVQIEHGKWREVSLALGGRRVLAVSGLADPAGFYEMIRGLDADLVGVLEYPDHHTYSASDWHEIAQAARDADLVLTTEKDLVKLERFPFARDSLYALRLEVSMGPDEARLLKLILGKGDRRVQAAQTGERGGLAHGC